ncbi:MAG: hypothetical protein ABI704_13070 [Kofleriaceae bacterium]
MNYAVTNDIIRELIREMPDSIFDSHALIFRIMQRYPREYTRDANAVLENTAPGTDPITQHHATLGTRFSGIETIAATPRKVSSMNVRGQNTDNQEWRRL